VTAAVDTRPPVITVEGPSYPFGSYAYLVDGETVATIQASSFGAIYGWDHETDRARWHRDVMVRTEWSVYLARSASGPRWFDTLTDAQHAAMEYAESATRCHRPADCGLCRLPARHLGGCRNYWTDDNGSRVDGPSPYTARARLDAARR